MTNFWLGLLYSYAGRYDESIQQMEKVLDLDPDEFHAYYFLAENYIFKEMYQKAISYADTALSIGYYTQNDLPTLAHVGWIYAKAGKPDKAKKILENLFELSNEKIVDPIRFAFIYAGLGDKEEAFNWLSKGVEERSGHSIYLKGYADWIFKDIRSDPRYDELLRKIGFKVIER